MDNSVFNDLPDMLRAEDVSKALRISRSSAYALMHAGDFPAFRPLGGKSLRVSKASFLAWLDTCADKEDFCNGKR